MYIALREQKRLGRVLSVLGRSHLHSVIKNNADGFEKKKENCTVTLAYSGLVHRRSARTTYGRILTRNRFLLIQYYVDARAGEK